MQGNPRLKAPRLSNRTSTNDDNPQQLFKCFLSKNRKCSPTTPPTSWHIITIFSKYLARGWHSQWVIHFLLMAGEKRRVMQRGGWPTTAATVATTTIRSWDVAIHHGHVHERSPQETNGDKNNGTGTLLGVLRIGGFRLDFGGFWMFLVGFVGFW